MTQEEKVLEYNNRCAKFLGVEYEIHSKTHRYKNLISTELLFHLDWNWIMEIKEVIGGLKADDFYMEWFVLDGPNVSLYKRHRQDGTVLWECMGRFSKAKTQKQAIVYIINEFLIWYKQNKL